MAEEKDREVGVDVGYGKPGFSARAQASGRGGRNSAKAGSKGDAPAESPVDGGGTKTGFAVPGLLLGPGPKTGLVAPAGPRKGRADTQPITTGLRVKRRTKKGRADSQPVKTGRGARRRRR